MNLPTIELRLQIARREIQLAKIPIYTEINTPKKPIQKYKSHDYIKSKDAEGEVHSVSFHAANNDWIYCIYNKKMANGMLSKSPIGMACITQSELI